MAQRQLRQIDADTGEVLDGYAALVVPKRRNGFGKDWLAMSQHGLKILAQVKRNSDLRVLLALLARLDFENLIVVSQAEIAEELNMDRSNVNAAVRHLLELGAVLEGPKIGVHRSYRLNPSFGWKGSAANHQKALRDHLRLVKGGR